MRGKVKAKSTRPLDAAYREIVECAERIVGREPEVQGGSAWESAWWEMSNFVLTISIERKEPEQQQLSRLVDAPERKRKEAEAQLGKVCVFCKERTATRIVDVSWYDYVACCEDCAKHLA